MQTKVLVVDDDKNICDLLHYTLEKDGYSVVKANDGANAIGKFDSSNPDIVLLDIMLGGIDGWDVCREIRKKSDIPIIMITSKNDTFDKVLGLELGADDYIIKPFEVKEVLARVKAVLRRSNQSKSKPSTNSLKIINLDKLSINLTNYVLRVCDKTIDTPPKEIELLYFLASNPNRVYTRDQLLDEVWGFNYYGDSRTIDVHIKRLREKLDGAKAGWELKTVWGVGYKFEVDEEVVVAN
jgi:DNA-binding response OmpR family regulator